MWTGQTQSSVLIICYLSHPISSLSLSTFLRNPSSEMADLSFYVGVIGNMTILFARVYYHLHISYTHKVM